MIDLHTHTTASDGDHSPTQLVDAAIKNKTTVIAITDHDTVGGLEEAQAYAQDKPVKVIPGIELSCQETEMGYDEVHVLGLGIDFKNPELVALCERIKTSRDDQKKKIIEKLNELGFEVSYDDIKKTVKHSFGRPHIARALVDKYPKEFKTVADVFDTYLGNGKPAYVDREFRLRAKEAIPVIHKAGGKAILAHPGIYADDDAERLIKAFLEWGGQGIETAYPYHINIRNVSEDESRRKNEFFKTLAESKNMLQSGGTDFHGAIRATQVGQFGISEEIFSRLSLDH